MVDDAGRIALLMAENSVLAAENSVLRARVALATWFGVIWKPRVPPDFSLLRPANSLSKQGTELGDQADVHPIYIADDAAAVDLEQPQ